MLRAFQWRDDRVEACIMLFCRISEARRLPELTDTLTSGKRPPLPPPPCNPPQWSTHPVHLL